MVGFAAASVAVAVFADESPVTRVLLGVAAAFLVFLGLRLWRMSAGSGTIVTVTEDGLRFERAGLIGWNEIEEVERRPFMGNAAVAIHTRDFYVAIRRQRMWWAYPLALLSRILGQPSMLFTEKTVPVDELFEEIERRRTAAPAQDARTAARLSR